MNKQELITVLRDALQAEGAVEVFPDPDSLPEQAGIRLCGNASLSRIADAIMAERSQSPLVTLTIDRNDLGQIIDGLTARADLYDETERHFNGEVILGEIAECNDAEEAHAIAEHYRKIIAQLEAAR